MQEPGFDPCLGNEIPHATAKSSNAATKIQCATTKTWNSQVNKLIIKKKKKEESPPEFSRNFLHSFWLYSSVPFYDFLKVCN